MKIECLKDKLKEAVNLAEKVTGKNLTLPILTTVLLEAKNKVLNIKATNLEIGLEIELPAKVEEDGIVAVNAQILANFLNNISNENKVILTAENNNLKISTSSTNTTIKSFPAEDFPIIPRVEDDISFNLKATDFISGLKSVMFAGAISDIKPEISSVYIYSMSNDLIFVATDSFRLAEKKIQIKEKNNEIIPLIIPLKNIIEINRIFENIDGNLQINSNKNQISIFSDSIHLTSRIIDGVYPDYRQIMPSAFKTELVIKKDEIVNVLKLSNIFSDKFNQIDLHLVPAENLLEIKSSNQDVGDNDISLIVKIKGEPLDISFNVKYILDCLAIINKEEVMFNFCDKNKPLLIQKNNDQSFKYIIMPINK